MKRGALIKALREKGIFFHHHGTRHDVFIHERTGKKITVPRHGEFSNDFLSELLAEVERWIQEKGRMP